MAIDRVILDFDNTLFNTDYFKVALASSLKPFGVPEEIFWGTYRLAWGGPSEQFGYTLERHVELINSRMPIERSAAITALQSVLDRSEEFLYRDAKEFLSRLIALAIPSVLLSRGDPEFQKAKITSSGVDRLVEKTVITDRPKIEKVGECIAGAQGTIFFIDDHLDATLEVVRRYPQITPVLKRRPDLPPERYLGARILNFRTLTEIRDYLTIVQATNPRFAGE